MTVRGNGDGNPPPNVCRDCDSSYWEEMVYGEDAYCSEYNKLCEKAISECKYICRCK